MPRAISERFPKSYYQQCLVHLSQDIYSRVRVRDRQEILNDFKDIHNSKTLAEGKSVLRKFVLKWHSLCPRLMENIRNNGHLLTFLHFPE